MIKLYNQTIAIDGEDFENLSEQLRNEFQNKIINFNGTNKLLTTALQEVYEVANGKLNVVIDDELPVTTEANTQYWVSTYNGTTLEEGRFIIMTDSLNVATCIGQSGVDFSDYIKKSDLKTQATSSSTDTEVVSAKGTWDAKTRMYVMAGGTRLANPRTGNFIYDSDEKMPKIYNGEEWQNFGGGDVGKVIEEEIFTWSVISDGNTYTLIENKKFSNYKMLRFVLSAKTGNANINTVTISSEEFQLGDPIAFWSAGSAYLVLSRVSDTQFRISTNGLGEKKVKIVGYKTLTEEQQAANPPVDILFNGFNGTGNITVNDITNYRLLGFIATSTNSSYIDVSNSVFVTVDQFKSGISGATVFVRCGNGVVVRYINDTTIDVNQAPNNQKLMTIIGIR